MKFGLLGPQNASATVVEETLEAINGIPQELIPEWLAKQILALPRLAAHGTFASSARISR